MRQRGSGDAIDEPQSGWKDRKTARVRRGGTHAAASRRRGGVPEPERLEPYENHALRAREHKDVLVKDLADLSGGDLRKLMPAEHIAGGYKRRTDIDRNEIVLYDPHDWGLAFLASFEMTVEAARSKKILFLPAMRAAVNRRALARGGPREPMSEDLDAVVQKFYSRA